jgi:radical SAM-linked protein
MRYTSHLDLHRTWERTLRRANLPLTYSKGFNPRPKIILAAALPLGFTSDCELVEIWLDEEIRLNEIETKLLEALPPGVKIKSIEEVDPTSPKIPNLIDTADYTVGLLDEVPDLEQRTKQLMVAAKLPRERRGKKYDLRPLIDHIIIITNSDFESCLEMRLAARSGATGRPEEVLKAIEVDPLTARIHRKALNLKSN